MFIYKLGVIIIGKFTKIYEIFIIHQLSVTATKWVLVLFCSFSLLKNHKIANKFATNEAIEKIILNLESLEI